MLALFAIIETSERQAMRHLLISAALAGAVLTAMPPAEAKSIWLKCSSQVINLDSTKEKFSLTYGDKVYQGQAMFSPGQINFEFQTFGDPRGAISLKSAYSIDRKSLNYTNTSMDRIVLSSSYDTGWVPQKSTAEAPNPISGKCSIMKTPPTTGNKI